MGANDNLEPWGHDRLRKATTLITNVLKVHPCPHAGCVLLNLKHSIRMAVTRELYEQAALMRDACTLWETFVCDPDASWPKDWRRFLQDDPDQATAPFEQPAHRRG